MNKKQSIAAWVITGIVTIILLIILPYKLLYRLLVGFILWLIIYLLSLVEEKTKKIKDLKEIIHYLENKFNILNKIENKEGNQYDGHPFREGWIQYELRYIIKEGDKKK